MRRIRNSRVKSTRLLCESIARLPDPPQTLVTASAVGVFGDRGEEVLHEDSPGGSGFLPCLSREWEAATEPARARGVRVVQLRFGIVLSPRGGALERMLPAFRLRVGGPLGDGNQFMSWIAIDDAIGIVHRALYDATLHGPVNAVAPHPVRNSEFTAMLARVLRRPTVISIPAPVIRALLGRMGEDLLLWSQRAQPRKLLETGYGFRFPELEGALRHVLVKPTNH